MQERVDAQVDFEKMLMKRRQEEKIDALTDTVEALQEQVVLKDDTAEAVIGGLKRIHNVLTESQQAVQQLKDKHGEISELTILNRKAAASQQASAKKLWAIDQREREIQLERRKLLHEMQEQSESVRLRLDTQFEAQVTVQTLTTCVASDLETVTQINQEVVEAAREFLNVSPEITNISMPTL